jgi:hypothetical protein
MMQPISSWASKASKAVPSSLGKGVAQGIERLGTVQADQADLVVGLDQDVLVAHMGLLLMNESAIRPGVAATGTANRRISQK